MVIGIIVTSVINYIYSMLLSLIFKGVKMCLESAIVTKDIFERFPFIDKIYGKMQVIALSLFILIVLYQIIKSMFAYLGFETDEPWKIGLRAIIFGFLLLQAKSICVLALNLFNIVISQIWNIWNEESIANPFVSGNMADSFVNSFQSSLMTAGLFSIEGLIGIYLVFKLVMLIFKFTERIVYIMLLIIASPLAFATGVSKSTKGFLQGWVKIFVGNFILQLMQVTVFTMIPLINNNRFDFMSPNPIIRLVLIIGAIKVLEKLEEIVRDVSVGVGIGGAPLMGPMQALSQLSQPIYSINAIKGIFGDAGSKSNITNGVPPKPG